jgi:PAS domain S-box-containing protein
MAQLGRIPQRFERFVTVERAKRAIYVVVLLLLGMVAALTWSNSRRTLAADSLVDHTRRVETQVEALAGSLIELESGARGYALSGGETFRATAAEAEDAARRRVAEVRRLTADNPRQQEALDRLLQAVEEKIAFNEEVVAAREQGGVAAAAEMVATERGVQIMSRIRSLLDELRAEEGRLLRSQTTRLDLLRNRTVLLSSVAIALLVIALAGFIVLARADAVARRRAAEQTRLSEQRFRMLLGAVRDYAIILLDADGRVENWSGAAERIFGYPAVDAVGQHLSRFYPPGGDAQRELVQAARDGRYEEQGLRQRRDGEVFWADVVVTAIRGDKGALRGFAKIVRDVTERKQLDDALRDTAQKLERSNRELQDFAMVASHDLQEPLRKIQMFGDKLTRKYAASLGEEGRDWLTRMQNAAVRGQSLIEGLLQFSRVTTKAQPIVPVNLAATAQEVVSDLESRISEVRGRVELGDLPVIDADPLQMRQLFQNLIGNALKFRRDDTPPLVRVDSRSRDGTGIRLEVADNGIGFDEKYVDRIFKLFQRLHERGTYEGSGMGLAICRKIVERHGGSITARSTPGRGTTFVIDLPTRQPTNATRQ